MPHPRSRLARLLRVRWRRLLRRLERVAPLLLAWVPSWGTSLLLHGLAVLLLALYFYVRSAGAGPREGTFRGTIANQLTEDLTSLFDSDHAGDPFTNLKSPEPPSLSVEVPDPSIEAISQPEIQVARFAPDLAGPEGPADLGPSLGTVVDPGPGTSPKGAKAASYRLHAEDITAPFSGRSGPIKAKLLRREGGTVHSEKAVEDGLDWI